MHDDVGDPAMISESVVRGSIVDSWLERRGLPKGQESLVLQVAPLGHPHDLWIIEASTALVGDVGWLADLGENLCHGSPIAASGRLKDGGLLSATALQIDR